MRANDIFNIKIEAQGEEGIFTGRVLYWWEEQNIKINSLYEDSTTKKLLIEHSKIFIDTVDQFLISVECGGKIINKEKLHKISMEKNKNIKFSDILHHSTVNPLYEAYIELSGSSMKKMQDFRKAVMAAYDKNLRVEQFDDFPMPPEVIEYDFITTNGVITRSDLLNMSYAEVLKFQVIRDINKRMVSVNSPIMPTIQEAFKSNQPTTNFINNQFDHQNINDVAKEFFPDVTI